jgi:3-oxoacyl-[acyl-carrier protein] reductase
MLKNQLSKDSVEQFMKHIPSRRFGKPHEIASLVEFLCSDDAGYINGSSIVIDGGLSSHLGLIN